MQPAPFSAHPVPGLGTAYIYHEEFDGGIVHVELDEGFVQGPLNDVISPADLPADRRLKFKTSESARTSPELAKFMEVLSHWDSDGLPGPDHGDLLHKIDAALPHDDDLPVVFQRPNGGFFTKAVMAVMPEQPKFQIVYSFGKLRVHYRPKHYFGGALMLAIFIGLVQLEVYLAPWLKYSVLTGISTALTALGFNEVLALAVTITLVVLYMRHSSKGVQQLVSPHTIGFFNRAAIWEEQLFREGAEDWNFQQRLRACLAFGLIHLANMFYPLATVLPLSIGGGLLVWTYLHSMRLHNFRRRAVLDASVWHRVYNRMALIIVAVTLPLAFGITLISGLLSLVLALGAGVVVLYIDDHVDTLELKRKLVPATVN